VEHVTLSEEFLMTALLATKLVSGGWGNPDVIFAVSPGGCMVAEWLSRRFLGNWKRPIPVCTLVVKTTRTATGQPSAEAIIEEREIAEGCAAWPLADQGKALLVSDISRSGGALAVTFGFLAEHYGADRVAMATLMCQEGGPVTPHFCLVETNRVVRFDWKEEW
jgi:hypoxanthine phosphoribosyltransferase